MLGFKTIDVAGRKVQVSADEVWYLGIMTQRALAGDGWTMAELNLLSAIELPGAEGLIVRDYLAILREWADVVERVTDQNYYRFRRDPAEYDHSEPYWRMLILTGVLQRHFGVGYNRAKIEEMDWTDSRDLFLHGLLGPRRTGTCPSLPVLVAAVARRLGYPVRLVLAPGHSFSRWDDPRSGVRFNMECHGNGLVVHPDDYYHRYPIVWGPELHAEQARLGPDRVFLRSLTPAEEVASFLVLRGHLWESVGRWGDATAVYNTAADLMPHHAGYERWACEAWRKAANPDYVMCGRPKWKGMTPNYHGLAAK
ncbi:MAG: hypothetical protein K2X82_06255 [Gemmataceae bacterium]|nr:hypothetical protein [Gemmataceae bacterium]